MLRNTVKTACVHLDGIGNESEFVSNAARYDALVIPPRPENIGALASLAEVAPYQDVMLFFSWANIPQWARTTTAKFDAQLYETKLARWLDFVDLWLPEVAEDNRIPGAEPAFSSWWGDWMPDVTRYEYAETFAEIVLGTVRQIEMLTGTRLGIMIDAAWDKIAWVLGTSNQGWWDNRGRRFDGDRDGVADTSDEINFRAQRSLAHSISLLRADDRQRLIIGNGGSSNTNAQNGRMWENFDAPEHSPRELAGMRVGSGRPGVADYRNAPKRFSIVTAQRSRWEYATAASLLFDDLHVHVSEDDLHHGGFRWFDLWDRNLGVARGPAAQSLTDNGEEVWSREFTRDARAVVNVTTRAGWVEG